MPKLKRRDFNAEVEAVLHSVFEQHKDEELSLAEVTALAVETGRLDPAMLDAVREKAVQQFFGRVMRRKTFLDDHGDEVRKYHSYKQFEQTEDGREVQRDLWRRIDDMSPRQITTSARARLGQADSIVVKVRIDVRYWDEHVSPKFGGEHVATQLGLDLGDDESGAPVRPR